MDVDTLLLNLVSKLDGYGITTAAYAPLVQRGKEIMTDVASLAVRRLEVLAGGTDPLTVDQIDAELHVCEDRMLELLASVEAAANASGVQVLQAVLAQLLAVAIKAIV